MPWSSRQRWRGDRHPEAAVVEASGGLRGAGCRRCIAAAADSVELFADPSGHGGVDLGEDVADHPGSMAVLCLGGARGFVGQEGGGGDAVDQREGPKGPREGLLDVGLVVADQLPNQTEAVDANVGIATSAMVDEGN